MATTKKKKEEKTYVVRGSNHSHELLQITFRNVWKYTIFRPSLHSAMGNGNKVYLLILYVWVCAGFAKQIFNWLRQMEMNWMCQWIMLWVSIHQCDYQCKWHVWNAWKLPTLMLFQLRYCMGRQCKLIGTSLNDGMNHECSKRNWKFSCRYGCRIVFGISFPAAAII